MNSRHCPICGDDIPASAHRLKKLCGKKECLLEQQRISSRKSYHKVLGHTEPEKRSCVVCGADISHLRGNRVVCEKPECKKEIKRRSGYDYFKRNSGNELIMEKNRLNQRKYRAAKPKGERRCQICRDDITHLPGARTICYKQSCIEYRDRLRGQSGRQASVKSSSPKPPTINKNYQRVPKPHQKPVMQKKIVQPRRIIEDDKPWVPMKAFNLPESMPQHTMVHSSLADTSFSDPWNCQACRGSSALCRLHQKMTDCGSKPPSFMATYNLSKEI